MITGGWVRVLWNQGNFIFAELYWLSRGLSYTRHGEYRVFFGNRLSNSFRSGNGNNRWSGEYIRNYREGKGVRLWHKVLALSLLWGTIGYSVLFVVQWWWLRVILLGIAVGVSVHLLRMKTYRPES